MKRGDWEKALENYLDMENEVKLSNNTGDDLAKAYMHIGRLMAICAAMLFDDRNVALYREALRLRCEEK